MTPTEMHIDALMEKIEALEAQNDKFFNAYEEARSDNTAHFRKIMELQKENERLKSENARLREALKDIAEKIDCTCRYCVGCNQGSKMINRAEDALEGFK
jgi:predicted  nucleic acid-binding Zn-ribbon protein